MRVTSRRRRVSAGRSGPLGRLSLLLGFFLVLVFIGPMAVIVGAYTVLVRDLGAVGREMEDVRGNTEAALGSSAAELQRTVDDARRAVGSVMRLHLRDRLVDLADRVENAIGRLPEASRTDPLALLSLPEIERVRERTLPGRDMAAIVNPRSGAVVVHRDHPAGASLADSLPELDSLLQAEWASIEPLLHQSPDAVEPQELGSEAEDLALPSPLRFGRLSDRRPVVVRTHAGDDGDTWIWLATPLEGTPFILAMRSSLTSLSHALLAEIPETIAHNRDEVRASVERINEMVENFQSHRRELEATLNRGLLHGGAFALGLVALALLVIRRRVVDPMRRMTEVAERVQDGDYASRVSVRTGGEIGDLARAMDEMLDRIVGLIQSDEDRRRMQQSIVDLLDQVSRASEGDLTVRGPVTDDVLGSVVDALNHMLESISRLIVQVRTAGRQVTGATDAILGAQRRVDEGSQRQSERLVAAVSVVEAVADSMREMAGAAGAASEASKDADQAASRGRLAVEDSVRAMYAIHREVAMAARRIKGLGERSMEIDTIVEIIDRIAAETNVLALNASIEASRAGGERGKGFESVAEEVQRLAERSSAATREISALARAIQEGAGHAVAAMEAVQGQVEAGVRTADDAGLALSEIGRVVHTASQLIESIDDSATAEAEGVGEMTATLEELRLLAAETVEQVALTTRSVDELQELSAALDEAMLRFRVEQVLPEASLRSLLAQREELEDSMTELREALASAGGDSADLARLSQAADEARGRLSRLLDEALGETSPARQPAAAEDPSGS